LKHFLRETPFLPNFPLPYGNESAQSQDMRVWQMIDEFFGWLRVIFIIVSGPILIILALVSDMWGYAVVGILFSIFGAFVLKWILGK
jgi:hypothetical protein